MQAIFRGPENNYKDPINKKTLINFNFAHKYIAIEK